MERNYVTVAPCINNTQAVKYINDIYVDLVPPLYSCKGVKQLFLHFVPVNVD